MTSFSAPATVRSVPDTRVLSLLAAFAICAVPLAAQTPDDGRRCSAVVGGASPEATKAARAHAARVVAEQKQSAIGAFYAGCLAWAEHGSARAAGHFERATKLDDRSGTSFDWLGRAYGEQLQRANPLRQATQAPRTRNAFERAVALDPDNLDARAFLVEYYRRAPGVAGGSKDKAAAHIAEIRRRNAYRGGLLSARSNQQDRKVEAALTDLQALVTQYPDSAAPVSALAALLVEQGRHVEAFGVLDQGLARLPESRILLYASGRAAAVSGHRLDDGVRALERYLRAPSASGEPSHAAAHVRLGNIHERRGDAAAARATYDAALRLEPENAEARKARANLK